MRNQIDYLTDTLTESTGVLFARDAWENKAPDDYGVVVLGDALDQQWADGHLIDEIYDVQIYLYTTANDDTWGEQLMAVIQTLEDADILTATCAPRRSFDMNVGKVCWQLSCQLYGPLVVDDDG